MDALDTVVESFLKIEDTNKTLKKLEEEGVELLTNKQKDKEHKIFYGLSEDDRALAVYQSIVPKAYKYATFDTDRIMSNLINQYKRRKGMYTISGIKYNKYLQICQGILSSIRMGKLPDKSYLIGAPNGFGKTSFVMECLMTLLKMSYNVVPYISLWELAQIRVENEHRLMNPYKKFEDKEKNYAYTNPNVTPGFVKKPEIIVGRYSYSEYINADCLFVSLTDLISKDIESHTLYQLLNIRGSKGLPTIVMMSTSLVPYKNDRNLRIQVWDEIETSIEQEGCYDRLYHISCYKTSTIGLNTNNMKIDPNTGIELSEK